MPASTRKRACKFCGCTQTRPCLIPAGYFEDQLARPCAWLVADSDSGPVCSAPPCVQKAYAETSDRVTRALLQIDDRRIEIADMLALDELLGRAG